jgi:hypothetical protein
MVEEVPENRRPGREKARWGEQIGRGKSKHQPIQRASPAANLDKGLPLYASTLNLRNGHLGTPLSFGSEGEQAKLIPQLFTGSI